MYNFGGDLTDTLSTTKTLHTWQVGNCRLQYRSSTCGHYALPYHRESVVGSKYAVDTSKQSLKKVMVVQHMKHIVARSTRCVVFLFSKLNQTIKGYVDPILVIVND